MFWLGQVWHGEASPGGAGLGLARHGEAKAMSEVICIKKLAEKYKVEGFCRCPRCNAEALPLFKKTQGAGGREQGEKEEKDDVLDRVRSGDVCGGVRGNIYPGLTDIGEGAKNAISGEKTE